MSFYRSATGIINRALGVRDTGFIPLFLALD